MSGDVETLPDDLDEDDEFEDDDHCTVCGDELNGESHYHCGGCGEVTGMFGHTSPATVGFTCKPGSDGD